MIRTTFLAAAAAALLSAPAFAAGPVLVDEANSPTIVYDMPSANIVGSADATVSGAPGQTQYETRQVFRTQAPSLARNPSQIVVDSSN